MIKPATGLIQFEKGLMEPSLSCEFRSLAPHRHQHPVVVGPGPRDKLLTVPAPVHDEHRLHWLPASHDQMLETMAIHGPFPVARRAGARSGQDSLAVFVEPDGQSYFSTPFVQTITHQKGTRAVTKATTMRAQKNHDARDNAGT